MKILFIHKDLNQGVNAGGINTVYLKHIEELEKTNNELFCITSRSGKWNLKCKRYIVTFDREKRQDEIEKIINEIDPDIIDVFSWNAEILNYVKKNHRAKIIMRGDIPMHFYGLESIDEEMARYVDKVISISKWCDSEWSSVIGHNTTIIPHACDLNVKKNISKIPNTVVWIGKETYIKGFDFLFELPNDFFKKYKLTVVCAKTKYSDISKFKLLKSKGVEIKENLSTDDYNDLLESSEYVLSTARREGFCIAVLEAMQFGCVPLIPYWIGGTKDFVNNRNGIIYKNFNDCLAKMYKCNVKYKAELSKKTAEKYTWDKVVNKSLKVYKELNNE